MKVYNGGASFIFKFLYNEQSRKPSFILVPSNQSLESFIFGIAEGFVYLHENTKTRIIRRDIKASNILLDSSL
ncbi:hypothetical protein A4A49_08133 [Nicotiana attenuata]|uniref:Protein kinase domain-containing protein n=1 Tax=Nicotiana attenuata TaxID=49451 RepID=A0A1J6HUQ5_NICAT|nr:hypothetical protein A4A49_08133 [Nicotiana attenuata]